MADAAMAKQEKSESQETPEEEMTQTEEEEDLADFERKLIDLDINFADLDPELQNRLRSSKSSRTDFLAIHSTDKCYNPEDGTWMPQPTTKKREFGAITGREVPNMTTEANVQSAMMKYHEQSILPSLDQLYQCCDAFVYKMAQHEFALTQYTLERQAAQLQTLERVFLLGFGHDKFYEE
ncbi:YGR125W, partial [Symbiodinium sp. CCMP2456]